MPHENYISAFQVKKELELLTEANEKKKYLRQFHEGLNIKPAYRPAFESMDSFFQLMNAPHEVRSEEVIGVIIESRKYDLLPTVVSEFADSLSIPIQVFHGPQSSTWLEEGALNKYIEKGKVVLTEMPTDTLPAPMYNAMVMDKRFWEALIGRKKILLFQTDAVLCEGADYSLSDFVSFDYIGSRWPETRPIGVEVAGGNGGFSLRDWQKSRDCLNCYSSAAWGGAEDTYFAFHLSLMGANVAESDECEKFGTQHYFNKPSFGAHKIGCLSEEDKSRFIAYCEKASRLLDM